MIGTNSRSQRCIYPAGGAERNSIADSIDFHLSTCLFHRKTGKTCENVDIIDEKIIFLRQ